MKSAAKIRTFSDAAKFIFSPLAPPDTIFPVLPRYTSMNKIRYINLCIVEFGKRNGMPAAMAFNYLNAYKGFDFLDRNYEAEHLLPLDDTLSDLATYCRRHGGTMA